MQLRQAPCSEEQYFAYFDSGGTPHVAAVPQSHGDPSASPAQSLCQLLLCTAPSQVSVPYAPYERFPSAFHTFTSAAPTAVAPPLYTQTQRRPHVPPPTRLPSRAAPSKVAQHARRDEAHGLLRLRLAQHAVAVGISLEWGTGVGTWPGG